MDRQNNWRRRFRERAEKRKAIRTANRADPTGLMRLQALGYQRFRERAEMAGYNSHLQHLAGVLQMENAAPYGIDKPNG